MNPPLMPLNLSRSAGDLKKWRGKIGLIRDGSQREAKSEIQKQQTTEKILSGREKVESKC